jgi:2-methylcitrate dehydratase
MFGHAAQSASQTGFGMKSKPILRRDFLKRSALGAAALCSPEWSASFLGAQSGTTEVKMKSGSEGNHARIQRTVVEDMAGWVAALRYEDLPPAVVQRAKHVLLDTLGCALGAVDAGPVRMARQVVSEQGGNPQASIVGVGGKVSCVQAAFLNGMALRYLDYNDYAAMGTPHHCSINVAPALAVAEMQGLTGKNLLLGITAGFEVQLRLRDATEGVAGVRGWDTYTIASAYSSAAVAAKLLGLDASRIAFAIAIAGSHGNTLAEVRGAGLTSGGVMTHSKGTADPMSARLGTFAALLARAGLTYPLTILEGTAGYGKVVAGKLQENVLRERSGDFQILKSCIKLWPCFVYAQAPIAAALEIHNRKVAPEDIQNVTVGLSDVAYRNQQDFLGEITAREHADHSVPYAVARALLDGDVKVDDFDGRRFREPRAVEVIRKVSLRSDSGLSRPDQEALGAKLEVRLRNGLVLKADVLNPPGSLQNPADDASLMKKFLALSEQVLGKDRAPRAAEVILSAEKVTALKDLLEAVTPISSSG